MEPTRRDDSLTMRKFWNANTHYHSFVLSALAPGASRVLEVGCGDSMLSAELVDAGVPHVVSLDIDRPVLGRARRWQRWRLLRDRSSVSSTATGTTQRPSAGLRPLRTAR